jgi:BASS family bile acid:Na+ symporter
MQDFVMPLARLSLLIFVVSALFGTGATLTVRQILEPLRNIRLVITSFAVSFLVVPSIAFVITRIHPLEEPLKIGLILLSMTAGSEALPKITGIVKGNTAYAVGLMSMQIIVSLVYVPLLISALLPEVSISHFKLVMKLVLFVLLPLMGGLFLKARHEPAAAKMEHVLHKISMVSLVFVFVLLIVAKFAVVLEILHLEVVLAVIAYLALSFAAGYLLGGPNQDTRMTLAVGSILRSGGIALVVASQAFSDPKVVVMIMFILILMLPVLPAMVWMFRCCSPT